MYQVHTTKLYPIDGKDFCSQYSPAPRPLIMSSSSQNSCRQLTPMLVATDCSSAAASLLQTMVNFLSALALISAVVVAAAQTPSLRGEGVEDQASAPASRVRFPVAELMFFVCM